MKDQEIEGEVREEMKELRCTMYMYQLPKGNVIIV